MKFRQASKPISNMKETKLKLIKIHSDETNWCEEAHIAQRNWAIKKKTEEVKLFILSLGSGKKETAGGRG